MLQVEKWFYDSEVSEVCEVFDQLKYDVYDVLVWLVWIALLSISKFDSNLALKQNWEVWERYGVKHELKMFWCDF